MCGEFAPLISVHEGPRGGLYMSHRFTFKSSSVETAILTFAECFLPSGGEAYGMTPKDCLALATLQVNRFLEAAPEYKDANDQTYKFALGKGNKEDKRAEWSRTEKSAGGIRLDSADEAHLLGNRLGWFDQHTKAIEKGLGSYEVGLPVSISKPLQVIWEAALKQRAARASAPVNA